MILKLRKSLKRYFYTEIYNNVNLLFIKQQNDLFTFTWILTLIIEWLLWIIVILYHISFRPLSATLYVSHVTAAALIVDKNTKDKRINCE